MVCASVSLPSTRSTWPGVVQPRSKPGRFSVLGPGSLPHARDRLDHNCRQQGWMRFHPQARGLVAFIRSQCGFHGCSTLLLYDVSLPKRCPMVRQRPWPAQRTAPCLGGLPKSVGVAVRLPVTIEPGLVSPGVFVRVTPEPGGFAAGQTRYWVIPRPELRRPAYPSVLERR